MGWSLRIATLSGIGVYVHWSFLLLMGYFFVAPLLNGQSMAAAASSLGFVLAVFGCVVLHEFGHALAARRFNISTRDITLLPIGGVARLERMPEKPSQEFFVAIAGPLVNVVIAAILFLILLVGGLSQVTDNFEIVGGPFLFNLFVVNVILVLFNLLPAFPMDGGRILRAVLASRFGYTRATEIAARVGQVMAIVFGLLGLMVGNWFLIFIAFFVYLAASAEAAMVSMRSAFQGVPVRDAMYRRFLTVRPDESLVAAIAAMQDGYSHDFVVADGYELIGILHRQAVLNALATGNHEVSVREIMHTDCPVIQEDAMLDATFATLQSAGCSSLVVVSGDQPVGLISSDSVAQWSMLQAAESKGRNMIRSLQTRDAWEPADSINLSSRQITQDQRFPVR